MNSAAFQAEIYRAGLTAVPNGQIEAARMLGLGPLAIRTQILVPQMFRLVIPALVNETISILKNSSLVSVIAVTELMRVSQQIAAVTFRPMEIYLVVGVIYVVMNLFLSQLGTRAEARLSRSTGGSRVV